MKPIELGHIYSLRVTADRSAFISFALLWIVLSLVAVGLLYLPPLAGVLGAFIAVVLHFFSEFFHQLGHARAARRVGYPMRGMQFFLLLARSIYPKHEPPLPGSIHIRRALGGPIASLLLTLVAGLIYLAAGYLLMLDDQPGITRAPPDTLLVALVIALFFFLDNLLVFTLGALLPLGFTDGSTILYWWGRRDADNADK